MGTAQAVLMQANVTDIQVSQSKDQAKTVLIKYVSSSMTNACSYQSRRPRWNCDFLASSEHDTETSLQLEESPGRRVFPFSLPTPSILHSPLSSAPGFIPSPCRPRAAQAHSAGCIRAHRSGKRSESRPTAI